MFSPKLKVVKLGLNTFKKNKYKSTKNNSNEDWYAQRKKRLEYDNFKCAECGSIDKIEVHHIIPVSKGGNHSLSNLKTLCKDKCHAKQHKHIFKKLH